MKVRFHIWVVEVDHPTMGSNDSHCRYEEPVEVPDNPTDRDLIVAHELMLCGDWDNPDDIEDDWSPAVESDEDGRLFWGKTDGQWCGMWVEFLKEDTHHEA